MNRERARRFLTAAPWLAVLATLAGAAFTPPMRAAIPTEYGVRTRVMESPGTSHGRRYAILSVQMFSSDPRRLPPVDEDSLMLHVRHALDTHGFQPAAKGQDPEILITVHYGRAWLRNPYLTETGATPVTDGISSLAGLERKPNQDVTGTSTRYIDSRTNGYEAKIQKAAAEKLYIRITGWKYPPDGKAKARMLWQTTVIVDDPDRWNLNGVAAPMLAAAAPYFDREIDERELEVHPPPPEGHVNVGAVEVVESPAPKPSPGAAPAAPANRVEASRPKKFNVPAGDAVQTLQEFSRQSGEQIIFPIDQVRTIQTHRVVGELDPLAALEQMLDSTGLTAVQDEKTGALAVKPESHRAVPPLEAKTIRD